MQKTIIIENDFIRVTRNVWTKGETFSKHNHFNFHKTLIIESGKVRLRYWKEEKERNIVLETQSNYFIPAGCPRQLIILENSIGYKIYWKDLDMLKTDRDLRIELAKHMIPLYKNIKRF